MRNYEGRYNISRPKIPRFRLFLYLFKRIYIFNDVYNRSGIGDGDGGLQTRRTKSAGPTELTHDVKIIFQFPAPNEDSPFHQTRRSMTSESDGYRGNKYFVGRRIGIRVEPSAQKTSPVSNKIRYDSRVLNENIGLVLFAVSAKLGAIGRSLAITVFGPKIGIAFTGPHSRLRSMAMDTKDIHVSLDRFMRLNRSIEV